MERQGTAHLAKTFHWSTETSVDWVAIVASGIGMAGPALLGAVVGDQSSGLAASLGGFMIAGIGASRSLRTQADELVIAVVPAIAATITAALAAGHGWLTDVIVVLLAGVAATIGGYSRPAAMATARFIPFLIIALAVAETAPASVGLVFLILAGTLWATFVSILLGAVARAIRRGKKSAQGGSPASPATAALKFVRWRRTLENLAGWQYPLRLTLCLAIAGGLRSLWPDHHLYWISLTVVLLTERKIEIFPVRATQRALGTLLGVLVAGLLLVYRPPFWGLVVILGVLAGARPLLRTGNYLAYSTIMTPLVIVIMDSGQLLGVGVLIDRLVATLVGAALVIGANQILARAVAPLP